MDIKNLKGLKKAVGEYQRFNHTGDNSRYARLMYDKINNELWTDVFCSLGENEWIEYRSPSVINLGLLMRIAGINVTMENVKAFLIKCKE